MNNLNSSTPGTRPGTLRQRGSKVGSIRRAMSVGRSTFRHSMKVGHVKTIFEEPPEPESVGSLGINPEDNSLILNSPGADTEALDPCTQKELLNRLLSNAGTARNFVGNDIAKYTGMTDQDVDWISKPVAKMKWFEDYEEDENHPAMILPINGYQRELGRPGYLEAYRKIDKKNKFSIFRSRFL
eukprot:TRINITY_DN10676_c0_g1_i1.p1 TRINITY_DN10676_c0_g1~~TRINITY_DN10676_c0_g1_i1.p1  ORF type:complete len:184 (-),score=37.97 TRINITY_DN10676_c0_g1_i1:402-953(-)